MSTFDFMKQFSMSATLAPASGGSAPVSLDVWQRLLKVVRRAASHHENNERK
jgi:hypothetical protein